MMNNDSNDDDGDGVPDADEGIYLPLEKILFRFVSCHFVLI